MRDLWYILAIVVFYGLMLGYVAWLKRIGAGADGARGTDRGDRP